MAIIYTYPEAQDLVGKDLLVVSKHVDDTTLTTNSVTLSTLAKFLNSAPKMGNGTNSYVTQWADGPNGILEDSPMFTFDGGAGLKQVILTDGYRFVVDRDAATTVGDPEYAITQNGSNKTSFGWDDDGGGFGFLYNWAGKGFKFGSAALYPQLELLTDPDLKVISFSDFYAETNITIPNATSSSNGIIFTHPAGGASGVVNMYYNGAAAGSRFVISRAATGGAEIELESDGDINLNRTGNGGVLIGGLGNYADDAAAAAGGVPINGLYRNGNNIQIRIV